jgi:hypothetical protein
MAVQRCHKFYISTTQPIRDGLEQGFQAPIISTPGHLRNMESDGFRVIREVMISNAPVCPLFAHTVYPGDSEIKVV